MAFTNSERAEIRAYLGYPSLFWDFNSRLESALTAIDGLSDDGATLTRMRSVLAQLAALDSRITELHALCFVRTAGTDQVSTDAIRAIHYLKMEGRRLIAQLAIPLACEVQRDYYSPSQVNPDASGMSVFPYGD